MSNFDTVFSTAPKWTNVEAIDATDVINSAYKNAELQNKAFKQLTEAGADVFKYAQQHKLNEVEKEINAMNLDQFQTTDKAALIDDLITKYGTDIGGFDAANINSINKYVDGRNTTLIKDAVDAIDYDSKSRKNTTEVMQYDADNTADVIHNLTKTTSLLPDGHPDKDKIYQQIESLTEKFMTKHPSGSTFLNRSLQSIVDADKKAKIESVRLDNAHVDEVVKLYGSAYISYLTQISALKAEEAKANKLEDSEAKKQALADIAFDKAALISHYGSEMIESLKNPLILARLEQNAYNDFHAKRMNEAEYEAAISAIENAKKELDIKWAKVNNDYKLGKQENAIKLFKATNEDKGSGRSSSEVKDATKNNVNRLTSIGLTEEQALGFIGENGEFNPNKVLASTLAYANKLHTQHNNSHIQGSKVSSSEWFTKEAPNLAKNAGVSDTRLRDYFDLARKHGKTDAERIKIVEAGIAGRLDIAYQGNGWGIIDMFGVARNDSLDNMEYTLLNKKVLDNIRTEIANEAFYRAANDFSLYLQAINTAYPTGLEGFVKDNAVALDQNKAFKKYADANTIKLLDEALEAFPQQKQQSKSSDKEKNQSKTPTSTAPKTPVGWERSVENGKESLDKALRYFNIR
ncbi:hypothetical protein EJK48_0911 [Moraxella catarrhalis]|uniref:Uncharacterized protein n=1 Tax=Moraxella catarrhalis TaxID=480 RepID=A0A3Q9GGP8_MORCA|nr:hypothetical protein [Moraxella catarrhalis]AZQ92955.1 hypothetical protein EJK53_0905 [Moraxella catarrhalis]AZQ95277.1 hypothetical protein EJK48_0911 [Moraxella catarrhalis]RUO12055.1 hypothetical protein EJK49_0025 [Moraxella catarrhalis]